MKVRLELAARVASDNRPSIIIRAVDDADVDVKPTVLARGHGGSIREASLALLSKFKEMQDATIVALSESGLARFVEDAERANGEMPS